MAVTLAALLAVPALAASTDSANVIDAFGKQIPAVDKKTTVPVLLPSTLPFAGKVPRLYPSGVATRNSWTLVFSGAPRCGGANACFLASFEGKRGGKIPGKSNLKLAGGQGRVEGEVEVEDEPAPVAAQIGAFRRVQEVPAAAVGRCPVRRVAEREEQAASVSVEPEAVEPERDSVELELRVREPREAAFRDVELGRVG